MAETGFSYLVEESLGKQWHFTLSSEQKIQYACRENGRWTEPVSIDNQSVKLFRAAIDKRDRIHLLAYTLSKQLIYYEWDGDQWYHRMLYRISSRFENISYLEVLSTAGSIHLLYYIENSLKRAQESFVHSYLDNGRWKSDILMNFLTDQIVVPQLACSDEKGNLYCIYTKTLRNQAHCYFIKFDNRNAIWSKPVVLFHKPVKCSSFNGFVDSAGIMHIIWQERAAQKYSLYYKKIDTEALNFSSIEICIHEGNSPFLYPCISSGNGYHCWWIQDGKAMASHADHKGNHWDPPREITDKPLQPYIHVHKTLDGRSHSLLELGDGSPGFEWTMRRFFADSQGIQDKQGQDAKTESLQQPSSRMEYRPDASVLQDLRELNEKVDKAAARMDEFYTALYQLQDYIRQKDKSFFQMDAQLRKLSFEVEQLRSARSSGRSRTSSYVPVHTDEGMKLGIRSISEQEVSSNETAKSVSEMDVSSRTDTESAFEAVESNGKHKPKDAAPINENDNGDTERALLKNIDHGTGEIQLGNVSILINPEDEEAESL
jgi:hypothetical protein